MSIEFTGERVVPGRVDTDLWNEHFARYLFAIPFCRNRRVLDAGCGTGYGVHAIASEASSVIGLDIAPDAVAYAQNEYPHANAHWVRGSGTQLPFFPSSFDVVLAFEVIEHLADWQQLIVEARRVLSADGHFIVSTPNKAFYALTREQSGPNPFHEHEFELDEFRDALTEVFPHVHIALENHASCVLFESEQTTRVDARLEGSSASVEANFYIAICSNAPIDAVSLVYVPKAANILNERAIHIRRLEGELQTKNEWLEQAQRKHADLVELHTQQTRELQSNNEWARDLDTKLKAARERIVELQDEVVADQEAALAMAQGYETQLQRVQTSLVESRAEIQHQIDELAKCVELLDKAEATVVERTDWALGLQRNLEQAEAQLAQARASKWVRLGRMMHVGPELNT